MLKMLRKIIPETFFLRVFFHRLTGFLAALCYGFPARNLKVIGVTGTDGKTTTSMMIAHILSTKYKVGLASSVYFQVGERKWKNKTHKTTLGRFALQKLLREMLRQGCEYAVLEASSIGLHQGRMAGIRFDIAVLTNLAGEHLSYHKTMERLARDKGRLFKKLRKKGVAVLNKDNEYYEFFSKYPAQKTLTYAVKNAADLQASEITESLDGISFKLNGEQLKLQVLGEFNVYNALAAAAVAQTVGLNAKEIKHALESFPGVPGRLERLNPGADFAIFLDFALTPQAFESLHRSLKKLTQGKLIPVFGACGGGRDTWRRKVIGKLAAEICDFPIITDDEPYADDPEEIIRQIKAGLFEANLEEGKDFIVLRDRREAISYAISIAHPGDVITLTGLGDFETRMTNEGEIKWSDREEVRKALSAKSR
ncbi:MAG: UDP-N-acetylmuramoyl-L-alanyl-D-glutamate--2,6-diaminopimelate ligase [Candidatus Gracilibacteria bacterium]|nr:UDP-N-acetylmuramoyl-L-alanyl-D-glutamate--2,6-diaminopimelate ligase [Candidatus Gracilibacteria bacterium]